MKTRVALQYLLMANTLLPERQASRKPVKFAEKDG